jgi:dephospho-CoA kinase
MIIGLTGGIASGKTTVSNILKELGAIIIDADKIAHEVLNKGEKGWKRVVKHFGNRILTDNGEIDRSYLGKIVFSNKDELRLLESITHPLIIEEIKNEIDRGRKTGKILVLDAPLLYETGLDRLVDQVWVVYVSKDIQLSRLKRRNGLNKKEAELRIDSQLSLKKKIEMADIVIDNNLSKKELINIVIKIWRDLSS